MHANQIVVTSATVARLVSEQFADWSRMPVRAVRSHGTVNAIFRIGPDLVARDPLEGGDAGPDTDGALPADVVEDTRRGLLAEMDAARRLQSVSPVATPEPVALGVPGSGYPLPWSVYRWLPGSPAGETRGADTPRFAQQLAGFVEAVRSLPTEGRTFEGKRRGGRLTAHDTYVSEGLVRSAGLIDTARLAALWERLRTAARTEADVWTHGDLMPGNLLLDEQGLCGVIDVGQLGVADPALDLQPAWNLFTPPAREAYRAALGCDDAMWERGRGWAFAQAIGCLWYYRETNPVMSRTAHRTLQALLDSP